MEIAVFEPLSKGDQGLFWMILSGALVCLALGLWGYKEKKQWVWMLGFFGVVILGGNAIFIKISEMYIVPIEIYENKISTPNGMIDFDDLISSKIQSGGIKLKQLNTNEPPEKVLIIESKGRKGVLLSQSQYPVIKIKEALDRQMTIYENQ